MPVTKVQQAEPTAQELLEKVKAAQQVAAAKGTLIPQKPVLNLSLPEAPQEPDLNLLHYTGLIYGREGVGKTTLLSSFPEVMFFMTEPGAKALKIFNFNGENGGVTSWDVLRAGVDLLVSNPGRFRTVVIDTADRAYDMCLDWCCKEMGIEYPGADADGEADFGKSWKAVKKEFLEQIYRIIQSGRGLWFTSHAKEVNIKVKGTNNSYDRVNPTMGKQAKETIQALVDFAFYGDYYSDAQQGVHRILICQGNDSLWAKARACGTKDFPRFLPLLQEKGFDVIQSAFSGEYLGLDVSKLSALKTTSKSASDLVGSIQRQAAIEKAQAAAKK